MKNAITASLLVMVLALMPQISRAMSGGDVEGNGGAGLESEGRYMTFYSSGLYTEPVPKDNTQVPALEKLRLFVKSFPYWSEGTRANLIGAIVPSDSHQYYKVKDDKFDATTRARILAEYSRVTHQPPEALHLFAVTDANSGMTFLLPAFYQLTETEQMTILFHETLWILLKDLDYAHVISAEMAFQAVLVQPGNLNRVADLLKNYGTNNDRLQFAIAADVKSNTLKSFLVDGKISVMKLFSQDWFQCYNHESDQSSCLHLVIPYVYELTQKYPNSFFLRLVYERLTQHAGSTVEISVTYAESSVDDGVHYTYGFHSIKAATLDFVIDRWSALAADRGPLKGHWSGQRSYYGEDNEGSGIEDGGGDFELFLFADKNSN
jgi:hypothetical protein